MYEFIRWKYLNSNSIATVEFYRSTEEMLTRAESYHIAFLQNSTLEYSIYYISVFTTVSVYCLLFDRSSHDLSINTYFTQAKLHIHLVTQFTYILHTSVSL